MEEHLSEVTHWFNHVFGPTALRLLHALHIQPKDFDRPIPEFVVMSLIVLIFCTILALILRPQLSVERPGAMQQIAELLLTNPMGFGIKDLLEENVGDEANRFIAFTGSVSIFILFSNLLSLFPGAPVAYGRGHRAAWLRASYLPVFQLSRIPSPRDRRVSEDVCGLAA